MATTRGKSKKTLTPLQGETEVKASVSRNDLCGDIDASNLGEEGKTKVLLMNLRFDALEGKLEAKSARISELATDVSKLRAAMTDLADQQDDVRSASYAGETLLSGNSVPQSTIGEKNPPSRQNHPRICLLYTSDAADE